MDETTTRSVELLKVGASAEQIAQRNGYGSVEQAMDAITAALLETPHASGRAGILLELQRLDLAQMAIAKQVRDGELRAVDTWLRISAQRTKYLEQLDGLGGPVPAEEEPRGCGTPAGYRKHKRNHEAACPECTRAWREHRREERAGKKKSGASTGQEGRTPPTREEILLGCRTALEEAIETARREDYTRLPPLVRELRETIAALGDSDKREDSLEDELARARQNREARRQSAAQGQADS